jgi:hypothetical protein
MSSSDYVSHRALSFNGFGLLSKCESKKAIGNPFHRRLFLGFTSSHVFEYASASSQKVRRNRFQGRQNASEQRTDDVS